MPPVGGLNLDAFGSAAERSKHLFSVNLARCNCPPPRRLFARALALELELSLVRSGLVSADDYVEALGRREEERLPLGQVAIEEGLLGVRQVLDVIRTQHGEPERRFGEVAVDKGYLTTSQVATLLMLQQERQRPVIDYLVELGRVSYEEAALAAKKGTRLGSLPATEPVTEPWEHAHPLVSV